MEKRVKRNEISTIRSKILHVKHLIINPCSSVRLQSCTEMVMPMCFDNVNDMFEKAEWNYTEYAMGCHKRWKVVPRPEMANLMYGEKDIQAASNIIFT